MITYIKLTNGSTTMLINMYDEARQKELLSDGFYYDLDKDGLPKTIDSASLIAGRNTEHSELIKKIQDKLNNDTKAENKQDNKQDDKSENKQETK